MGIYRHVRSSRSSICLSLLGDVIYRQGGLLGADGKLLGLTYRIKRTTLTGCGRGSVVAREAGPKMHPFMRNRRELN